MFSTRRLRHLTLWLALLATLAGSLAPSLSHALAAQGLPNTLWAEICTAAGIKKVALGPVAAERKKIDAHAEAGEPAKPASTVHHDDCPYCRLQVELPALPYVADPLPLRLTDGLPFPTLYYQSRQSLFAWASAQPRAPPARC